MSETSSFVSETSPTCNSPGSMDRCSHSRVWRQLPSALQLRILSLLPPNDRALSGRLVSPDARDLLTDLQDCIASLSQPLPPHAVPWAMAAGQQHVRQLPFMHKLQLLCTAAASGSEINLEVAWALLQLNVFPTLLQSGNPAWRVEELHTIDPGVAAAKAGHPQVLGWLQPRCPLLLCPHRMLAAAAQHCDLAGLQATWAACQQAQLQVGAGCSSGSSCNRVPFRPVLGQAVLHAAAESTTADGIAKMEWVLAAGNLVLDVGVIYSAARSGDLGRLQWLRDRGCQYIENRVRYPGLDYRTLQHVLEHAELGVVQRLVDEGGFQLPGREGAAQTWHEHLQQAAKSVDGVAKIRWLRERGAPMPDAEGPRLKELVLAAAAAGRADTVRYLLSLCQLREGSGGGGAEAAGNGGQSVAQLLRQAGITLPQQLYYIAAGSGNVVLTRWLVLDARVTVSGLNLYDVVQQWPNTTRANSRDLLEAVQLLAGAGYSPNVPLQYLAARKGNLALYQYLEQRWPIRSPHRQLVRDAASGGCEALLEWLAAQYPRCREQPAAHPYHSPAKKGDLGTLTAMRRLGVPWCGRNVITKAFDECPLPAVRWLAAQGAPVGKRTVMEFVAKKMRRSADARAARWLQRLVDAATD